MASEAKVAEHESEYPQIPPAPTKIEETGLKESFIEELILKALYVRGTMRGSEISDFLRLPFVIVSETLHNLRQQELCEVRRGQSTFEQQWDFSLTGKGIKRAQEVMEQNGYVGPCPVPLEEYIQYVNDNPPKWTGITYDVLREALKDLVIDDSLIHTLGPAFNSGKSMFLYGNAGNGKTSIAERFGGAMKGGQLVPYALEHKGQIIQLYDFAYHEPIDLPKNEGGKEHRPPQDRRWILCKRPFIIVGGELTMRMLELTYNPDVKFYVAPLQMKANGGCFMIDDFGRQQVSPTDLLNRWIVPLEKGWDYYTLVTGEQIRAPFQLLVIFSTNLSPKDLVDEAFLRRVRYKIEIGDPSEENFKKIFQIVASRMKIEWDEEAYNYLVERYYKQENRGFRASHPRDLLQQINDYCNYRGWEKKMTRELIDIAARSYFVKFF